MIIKTTFLVSLALLSHITLSAQRTYDIPFRATVPGIDGIVEEDSLQGLPVFDQFTTTLPSAGKTPQSPTKAWMIHTPEGIYVAAICSSTNLRNEGSLRDQTGTGDYLTLGFDTWNDDQNAFEFTVNAFGQRVEQRATSIATEVNFNTHWRVRTARRADGWTAEFFIPFTALRFSKGNLKDWGVQITRHDPSTGETSNWNPTNPLVRDRVLQYGTLENLVIGKTKQRLGVAVLARANQNYSSFGGNNNVISALDGQIGIGTAATLDISVLPDRNSVNTGYYFGGFPTGGYYSTFPRQLLTEEPGLFTKTGHRDQVFDIDPDELLPYYAAPQDFTKKNFLVLNRTRLTGRTNNGVGYGISNLLLTRPEATFNREDARKYPHQPFANDISLEKALRNNSWVQVSNRFYHLGVNELNNNSSSVATQLRDKSNTFEVSGRLTVQTQNKFTVADGMASIRKVNGIFQYGLTHVTQRKTHPGLIHNTGNLFAQAFYQPYTTGYLNWNNFSGTQKHWLNSTRYLQFGDNSFGIFGGESLYYLTVGQRGLNKRFQEINVSLSANPIGQKMALQFTDTRFISKQLVFPMATRLSITSDVRRRTTLQSIVQLMNTPFDRGQARLELRGRWIAQKKLVLSTGQSFGYIHQQRKALITTVASERLILQNKRLEYSVDATVQYTPWRMLTFFLALNNQFFSLQQRQLLEYTNGEFISYPYNFTNKHPNTNAYYFSIATDFNFNSASLLRFSYQSNAFDYYINSFPAGIIPEKKETYKWGEMNLSFIWNLNRI